MFIFVILMMNMLAHGIFLSQFFNNRCCFIYHSLFLPWNFFTLSNDVFSCLTDSLIHFVHEKSSTSSSFMGFRLESGHTHTHTDGYRKPPIAIATIKSVGQRWTEAIWAGTWIQARGKKNALYVFVNLLWFCHAIHKIWLHISHSFEYSCHVQAI